MIEAIVTQHYVTEEDDSTGSLNRLRRRVERRLVDVHGPGTVKTPAQKAFNRYVAALLPGRYTTGPATTRQSVANRPDGHYRPIAASRPGELVMIDTSWLDVRAYDPVEDVVFSVDLTIAIDICTRSLLGWRLVPKGTKGVDAGLVIADAMMPEPMRPGWPDGLRHRMLRLPCEPLLAQDQRFTAAAARPVVFPEEIVIDHGKAFASQAVKNVPPLRDHHPGHPQVPTHRQAAGRGRVQDDQKPVLRAHRRLQGQSCGAPRPGRGRGGPVDDRGTGGVLRRVRRRGLPAPSAQRAGAAGVPGDQPVAE
ncbi:hypothetical protein QQY66_19230 [Streptomyces sp. DG2A-72]|uniref:hypothetical protein n=1 Tax=Streptomyces sp. DG2A-72 TaxID=3051386 RepID=UPI00265B73B6|nr:hypothetical protein [Streptomyces sp. DG2A-72]MDO0933713.1 hypothetical protein [Streptomyces sp. DG2A-72]